MVCMVLGTYHTHQPYLIIWGYRTTPSLTLPSARQECKQCGAARTPDAEAAYAPSHAIHQGMGGPMRGGMGGMGGMGGYGGMGGGYGGMGGGGGGGGMKHSPVCLWSPTCLT